MKLEVNILGDQQLKRKILRFTEAVSDATQPLKEVAEDFWQIEAKQFDSEGGASGGWLALNQDYAKWKARNFPGAKILERTGILKGSLTNQNPWTVNEPEKLKVTVGTKVPYAAYHQTGGAGNRPPQRRPIDLTEADKRRWAKIFQTWLVYSAHRVITTADMEAEATAGFRQAVSV